MGVINEIQVVSEMIVSDKAAQHKINKNVEAQMNALEKKSDTDFSASKRARGKLKAILDENKRIAQEEVTALYEHTGKELTKLAKKQNEHLLGFKQDLTHATEGLYNKLSADKSPRLTPRRPSLVSWTPLRLLSLLSSAPPRSSSS